jgi:hypothetical protein
MAASWDAVAASANAATAAEARAAIGGGAAAGAGGGAGAFGGAVAGGAAWLAILRGSIAGFTLGDIGEKGQARIVNGRWQFKIGGKWVDVGQAGSKTSSAFTGGQNAFAQGGSLNAVSILTQGQKTANASVANTLKRAVRRHLSLLGQFNLLELRLANAEQQNNTVLQRSILISEENILLKLRDQAKTLKDRTGYAQQAASIADQIRGIDAASVKVAKKHVAAANKAAQAAQQYTTPLKLQVELARAQALGLDQAPILKQIRSKALAAIKSGKKALAGQLAAWNEYAQANDQLTNGAQGALTKFKHISTAAIAKQLGITGAANIRAARVVLAQVGAGSTVPPHRSPAFAGATGGSRQRTMTVVMHNPQFHGVTDVRKLEDELAKRARSRPVKRRG